MLNSDDGNIFSEEKKLVLSRGRVKDICIRTYALIGVKTQLLFSISNFCLFLEVYLTLDPLILSPLSVGWPGGGRPSLVCHNSKKDTSMLLW